MKTKLLKQLRASAKCMVYLVPMDGDTNNCAIVKLVYDNMSRGFHQRFYYRELQTCEGQPLGTSLEPTNITYKGTPVQRVNSADLCYLTNSRDFRKPVTIKMNLFRDEKGLPVVLQGGWPLQEALKVLTVLRREFILEKGREEMAGYYKRKESQMTKTLSKY